jgi:hypothetical protein
VATEKIPPNEVILCIQILHQAAVAVVGGEHIVAAAHVVVVKSMAVFVMHQRPVASTDPTNPLMSTR